MGMYVVQVMTGDEHLVMEMMKTAILMPEEDVFIPLCRRERKRHGRIEEITVRFFPGYVFLTSEEPELLFLRLKKIPEMTKMLRTGYEITALEPEEQKLIVHLMDEKYTIQMSRGIMVDDRVVVESGPLQGLEGVIDHIDRHRRTARIRLQLGRNKVSAVLGLEIVSRTYTDEQQGKEDRAGIREIPDTGEQI